jgi:hypothetical protein
MLGGWKWKKYVPGQMLDVFDVSQDVRGYIIDEYTLHDSRHNKRTEGGRDGKPSNVQELINFNPTSSTYRRRRRKTGNRVWQVEDSRQAFLRNKL